MQEGSECPPRAVAKLEGRLGSEATVVGDRDVRVGDQADWRTSAWASSSSPCDFGSFSQAASAAGWRWKRRTKRSTRHRGRGHYDLVQRTGEQQKLLRRGCRRRSASEASVRDSISRASDPHKHGVEQERRRLRSYRQELDCLEETQDEAAAA